MALVLALLAAALFGVADFSGGMATKRAPVLEVVAGSHVLGLAALAVLAPVFADAFTWTDLGIGAASGLFGAAGLLLLYRRLAAGPMQVVAPLTAVMSAAVPALWDVLTGGRLDGLEIVGTGLGLVAVVLVSLADTEADDSDSAPVTPTVIIESCLAGLGFGAMFILFDLTESATAPWPVFGARLLTSTLFVALLLQRRRANATQAAGARPVRTTLYWIAAAGLLDTAANVSFLVATSKGQLSLVAVMASLYPIGTAVLAWVVLGERLRSVQYVGVAAALAASILIAV